MAKVRQCVGRGANDFVMKLFNYNSLESQNKVQKFFTHPPSLSVGILLGDIKNCGLNEAENAAEANQKRAGVYLRRVKHYTVPTEHRPDASLENKIYYCYREPEDDLYSSKKRVQMTGWKVPKHRNYSKIWRNVSSSFGGQQSPCFGHLFRGCEQFVFIREYSGSGTTSEPLYKTKTGYYDVLGLSPSATQAQIKTAYYKQSFIYHPDRNAGSEEATVRFSVISEAYAVLGNKGLRKKYDRGLLSLSDFTATAKPASVKHRDSAGGSATHQAGSRRSVTGKDDVYFEEFYKSHYSKQLEKERRLRAQQEEQQKTEEETFEDKKMEVQVEFGMLFMALMAIAILVTIK